VKYCDQCVPSSSSEKCATSTLITSAQPLAPCLMVCLYVCPLAHLKNHASKFHDIFCTCYPWPWLDPPLTAMRYVMCFRFVDDVMFSHNGANWHNQRRRVCFVEFAGWRHRGRSMPSPTASCCSDEKKVITSQNVTYFRVLANQFDICAHSGANHYTPCTQKRQRHIYQRAVP